MSRPRHQRPTPPLEMTRAHIHIDKAVGGTNDGEATPFLPRQDALVLRKKIPIEEFSRRLSPPDEDMPPPRLDVEQYRLETFIADDTAITFWVEEHMSSAQAICHMLLRYAPSTTISEAMI